MRRVKRPMPNDLRDLVSTIKDAFNVSWFEALRIAKADLPAYRERKAEQREEQKIQEALVALWSVLPIGTPVVVTLDDGREMHTKTRWPARMTGGHASIWVEGIVGSYLLSRVRPDVRAGAASASTAPSD